MAIAGKRGKWYRGVGRTRTPRHSRRTETHTRLKRGMGDYLTAVHAGRRKVAQKGGRWGVTSWHIGGWSEPGRIRTVRIRSTYDRGRTVWVPHPAGGMVTKNLRRAGFKRTGITFLPDRWWR